MKPKLVHHTEEELRQRKAELEEAIRDYHSLDYLYHELDSVNFLLGEDDNNES